MMKNLTSRQKILFGVYAMILAMLGDYLLGFGTFSFSDSPDAYLGMTANVVPDWRYAVSSVLGFVCAALFAVAATELMKVMEKKYGLADSRLYKLFKIANWGGILYFAFIHIAASCVQRGNGDNRQPAGIDGYGPSCAEKYRGAAGAWLCDLRCVRHDRMDRISCQGKASCQEDRLDLQPGCYFASRAVDELYRGRPGLRLRILRMASDVSRMRIEAG